MTVDTATLELAENAAHAGDPGERGPRPWPTQPTGPAAQGGWLRREAFVIGLLFVALVLGFGAGLVAQDPTASGQYRALAEERQTLSAANEHLDGRIDTLERELGLLRQGEDSLAEREAELDGWEAELAERERALKLEEDSSSRSARPSR